MSVDESLVRRALEMGAPEDREHLLTVIEAYRLCVETARRLSRRTSMETQRQQVIKCAEFCERILGEYAASRPAHEMQYPTNADSDLVLTIRL